MKIVYLGYAMPEDRSEGNIAFSVAGNKMEIGYLTQLSKYCNVAVVTVPAIAPFPREKRLFVKKENMVISEGIIANSVGFINVPIIKQFIQAASVYFTAKKLIKEAAKDVVLLTYNAYPQVGTPARFLNKGIIKKCAIVADLPFDDASSRSFLSKIIVEMYNAQTRKNLKTYDLYILLNQKASEFILPDARTTIVEGAIDEREWGTPIFSGKRDIVVYSGALTDYSGIRELIEAWKLIDAQGKTLHIYGKGYLKQYIEDECAASDNIIYHGAIPNDEMREIQRRAYLLVNPRSTDSLISKYTFPSKILEYLASGTPVLTTKLTGITPDYYPFLSFSETSSVSDLKKTLESFFSANYSDHLEAAKKGREFVLHEKTWTKQIKRVYDFLQQVGNLS